MSVHPHGIFLSLHSIFRVHLQISDLPIDSARWKRSCSHPQRQTMDEQTKSNPCMSRLRGDAPLPKREKTVPRYETA